MKKSSSILVSLLALSLAACNGGGGSGGSSSGGDTPAPGPAPVYAHNGLTMSTVAVVDGVAKPVQLAKTFGHSQYYLLITNNNVESMMFTDIKYDTLYSSNLPLNGDITKYVMSFSSANINGQSVPACGFNSATGNVLLSGKSCAYKLNAMWADNQDTTTSTFNWKMSYLVWYGTFDINDTNNGTRVGKDCSLFTYQQCATSSEITTAENNQTLSYYLPNHSNAIGSDVLTSNYLNVLTNYDYSTGGTQGPVTNMNGDVLWVPNATAEIGSVNRFSLNYNSSTNTLTRGGLLNNYTGGTNWLQGAASSNLSGDTFFQYNYANNTNVEPLTPSSMGWMPGLDGAMYASTGNSAYGMLKVTPNGDGTFTSTKLPDVFKSPTNNIIQSVGANGNILTADYSANANYCYVNNGNNTYTKTKLANTSSRIFGIIYKGENYVFGPSNTLSGGTTYVDFSGVTLQSQPIISTKIDMNNCSPIYSSFLVSGTNGGYQFSQMSISNQYALIQNGAQTRIANINTLSNGADGN